MAKMFIGFWNINLTQLAANILSTNIYAHWTQVKLHASGVQAFCMKLKDSNYIN